MKFAPVFVTFIVLLIFLGGCKKTELTGKYSDYIGEWKRNSMKIDFKPNGRADYYEPSADFGNRLNNARVIIEGASLTIRKGFTKKEFIITMPPQEKSNGRWEMSLNNSIYTRY